MIALNRDRWETLWRSIPAMGDPDVWFDRLAGLYAESHRSYHSARHIVECLAEFDLCRQFAAEPVAVELAIWFHDAIYDTRAHDNEEKSAALAGECLQATQAPPALTRSVRDLVLVTKTHAAEPASDASLLVDVDLSILGQAPDRFWEYESQVRYEYSWVPEDAFRKGRADIIERFLQRPRLYATDIFFKKYELQARSNLKASLERLRGEA
jgi:predicted metal-dependent HD superfamily phosphohydrolase